MSVERAPTVLVVDDVPANLRLLLEALTQEGYAVLVAESGESALEQIGYGWPDAVLLDYRLRGSTVSRCAGACARCRAAPRFRSCS